MWGDPNQLGSGQNPFSGNPANHTDPFGLDDKTASVWDYIVVNVERGKKLADSAAALKKNGYSVRVTQELPVTGKDFWRTVKDKKVAVFYSHGNPDGGLYVGDTWLPWPLYLSAFFKEAFVFDIVRNNLINHDSEFLSPEEVKAACPSDKTDLPGVVVLAGCEQEKLAQVISEAGVAFVFYADRPLPELSASVWTGAFLAAYAEATGTVEARVNTAESAADVAAWNYVQGLGAEYAQEFPLSGKYMKVKTQAAEGE